ncbi:MAG TPA: class I SAM-dependent methyltransferase [Gemmatimonadota bacterium]|nr:class I SAM-dependent methyltransferase [Gemmatimonadota bacterium]
MCAVPSAYDRRLAGEEYRASRERRAALIEAVCHDRLREARTVVDLGAGTGLVRAALERLSGRPIVGFEIDRAFIDDPTRLAVADLLRLPVRNAAIDFGIANHVYEHVADLDRFFVELKRALAPAGAVYLTAGSRFALIEPHYRIPTLSWWPEPVASRILRWSGRGERYDDIRFTTRGRLIRTAGRAGLELDDLTDRVLSDHLERYESRIGRGVGRVARRIPRGVRRRGLNLFSPQWFFLVRHAGPA